MFPDTYSKLECVLQFYQSGSIHNFIFKVEIVEGSMRLSNFVFLYVEYAGHAVEMMLSMNLLHVDGIVICSGDGLVYEVLYFLD